MPIITITTDFGLKDYSLAAVKGSILKELPDARLVDISHDIRPFDLKETAFIIKNAYPNFPVGTVHIIGVDALPDRNKKLLAARIDGQYFLAADNGILSLILAETKPDEMVEITIGKYAPFSNFPTRDIFVPVACHLVRGGTLSLVGNATREFVSLNSLIPMKRDEETIIATVIYVDRFGNAITNVTKRYFKDFVHGRGFEIKFLTTSLTEVYERYNDVRPDEEQNHRMGTVFALFNCTGFLEISVYKSDPERQGAACTLFGLKEGEQIYISIKK
uniref:SAM hydrolase/SAM-dependent halogenase family protein n=1 Tax=Ornithobacterium rhinotracheale TaxID=28251 RepID=UPI0039A5739C